jgi:hypothetical protein
MTKAFKINLFLDRPFRDEEAVAITFSSAAILREDGVTGNRRDHGSECSATAIPFLTFKMISELYFRPIIGVLS